MKQGWRILNVPFLPSENLHCGAGTLGHYYGGNGKCSVCGCLPEQNLRVCGISCHRNGETEDYRKDCGRASLDGGDCPHRRGSIVFPWSLFVQSSGTVSEGLVSGLLQQCSIWGAGTLQCNYSGAAYHYQMPSNAPGRYL